MKRNQLIESINVNRARLNHAIKTGDVRLQGEALKTLVAVHATFFDFETKVEPMDQIETKYLVFSEKYPDGRVLSKVEYRALYRSMDAFDRETHQAIEVDGAVESDVEQALLGVSSSPSPKKVG